MRQIAWLRRENNSPKDGTRPNEEVVGRAPLVVSLLGQLNVYQFIYDMRIFASGEKLHT